MLLLMQEACCPYVSLAWQSWLLQGKAGKCIDQLCMEERSPCSSLLE